MITPAATTEAFVGTPAAGSASAFISAGVSPEARKRRRYTVAAFRRAFTDAAGWAAAPMSVRLTAPVAVRAFAAWLALTNQAPIDVAYVDAAGTSWGRQVALVHPDLAAAFITTAGRIGFTTTEVQRQWATLAKLTAISGLRPDQLRRHRYNAARDQLRAIVGRRCGGRTPLSLSTPLHGLEATPGLRT